jgi:TonB-dependent starch-binding outer membrane protein SusC
MKKLTLLIILFCMSGWAVMAQTRTVKGTVNDDAGKPLEGVSIIPSGGKTGTQTDASGNFSIPITGNPSLVVSYVGFATQTISTEGKDNISVTLISTAGSIDDDVVVIGYASVKRKDLTGSVSSVNARQLKDIPINSAAQALAGRLAGVQVTGTEGSPNADVLIRIRGGGSISQDNSPLFIVDGIQVENALNVLSPQDIESVDVLKDASATAIYGARGANGVMIITTKGGKNQKTAISYNGTFGLNRLANQLPVMDPYDFVVYQWERSRGNATEESNFARQYGSTFDTLSVYKDFPKTNWQEEMFGRDAMFQTHNVSMVGGNATTQYNLSLTYNMEEGIMLISEFDRKLVNFRLDHTVNSKLRVGFNTRYNNTIVRGAGTSNPGSSSTNRLRNSVKFRPLLLPGQAIDDFDEDYQNQTNANSLGLVNPILLNEAEYRMDKTDLTNLSGYIDWKLTPFLGFKTTLGMDLSNRRRDLFDDTITNNARLNGSNMPIAGIETINRRILNNSNVFTFTSNKLNNEFFKTHRFIALLGQETFMDDIRGLNQNAREFPVGIDPRKALANMNLGTQFIVNNRPPSFELQNRILSYFGRINYDWDNTVLASFSYRADGSTKFAKNNRWGYFPSGSVAWRLSNHSFYEPVKDVMNDFKVRASYGQAGNNRIGDFLYLTQFNANTQYWLNNTFNVGFAPEALANENLVWETTVARNLGFDMSFLNSKITLSVDIYKNTTKDLLIAVPVPTSSGYVTQIQNVGSTENRGVEFQVNANIMDKRNFSWTANFNASFNKNLVTSLGTYQDFYLRNSGWGFSNTPADFIVKEGQPVGSMWGFITDGWYTVDDFTFNPSNNTYTLKPGVPSNAPVLQPPQPGTLKFKDINGDGVINELDRSIIGVAQPKVFGGLNQMFTYKNFDASVFINFQLGNDVYNANRLEFTSAYQTNSNLLTDVLGRWKTIDEFGVLITDPEQLASMNANAQMWRPSTSSNSFVLHSWAVEDGSFVRINNVTIGYTLPAHLLKRMKLQRLRIFATGTNLAVFTNYSGYDPEVSTRRSTPETPGVDYSAYPRSRSFFGGINLTF